MFKKIISYLFPINIYTKTSSISKTIEVTLHNGELVLDANSVNYSYGSLQRALRVGLKQIGFERIQDMNDILVLGVAGGSVIKTLVDEIGYKGQIKGVELDPEIIAVAHRYFGLDNISTLEIVIADAKEFVQKETQTYDLIIIDVFEDHVMPGFLFQRAFADKVLDLLLPHGSILFNTLNTSSEDLQRNEVYKELFDLSQVKITTLTGIEGQNELLVISKKS